jgi:hypothetical protein
MALLIVFAQTFNELVYRHSSTDQCDHNQWDLVQLDHRDGKEGQQCQLLGKRS